MTQTNTIYNPSRSTKCIGVTGSVHKSVAEAVAPFKLYETGWVPCETKFPQQFIGTEYRAQPDLYHSASGFYAEFKARKMNGKGSKQASDKAMTQVDSYTNPAKRLFKALQHA